jgi:type IV pilus assembly protein PilX
MHPARNRARQIVARQQGAVLVTAMLLLLVLTIIGVTVMQMSRMQERMAGNSRDVNLAFQAAEGALRNAEALVAAQTIEPTPCSDTGCTWWQQNALDGNVANKDADWWEENGNAFELEAMAGLKEDPRAVIEVMGNVGRVRSDGGVTEPWEDWRNFYEVTSRSTGGSGEAEVVLQSTVTRPKF